MHSPYKTVRLIMVALLISGTPNAYSDALKNLVTVDDGLSYETPANTRDDYVRLTLISPDYLTASKIKQQVEDWLGPGMVRLQNESLLLVQAPRAGSARIAFIAALLALDIPMAP